MAGLARICPEKLRNHSVISLEIANLVSGTKYRGEFEERLQAIVEEVTDEKAPPTILFIDGEFWWHDHAYIDTMEQAARPKKDVPRSQIGLSFNCHEQKRGAADATHEISVRCF